MTEIQTMRGSPDVHICTETHINETYSVNGQDLRIIFAESDAVLVIGLTGGVLKANDFPEVLTEKCEAFMSYQERGKDRRVYTVNASYVSVDKCPHNSVAAGKQLYKRPCDNG